MRELKFIAVILTLSMTGIAAVNAQDAQDKTDKTAPAAGGSTESYVTSTGATVPRPDTLPKSYGETPLDRKIRERSKRIMSSICSGC